MFLCPPCHRSGRRGMVDGPIGTSFGHDVTDEGQAPGYSKRQPCWRLEYIHNRSPVGGSRSLFDTLREILERSPNNHLASSIETLQVLEPGTFRPVVTIHLERLA